MGIRNRVGIIPRHAFNSAGLDGNYAAANATGLEEPCFMIRIINDSDTDVEISYDGATDHDYLRTLDTLQIGFQSNSQPNSHRTLLARNTIIYFRGVAGVGNIYIVGYFSDPSI